MKRRLLFSASLLVLLAISSFLYYKTQAIELEMRIVLGLRELKQADAEWNANVLRLRAGIDADYEAINAPLPRVRALRDRLGTYVASGGPLEPNLITLNAVFANKEQTVQQFKSQNAILSIYLGHFPMALDEFKAMLSAVPAASSGKRAIAALEEKVDRLFTDLLRFNLLPDGYARERLMAQIEAIERPNPAYPASVVEGLDRLSRHARIILRQRSTSDALITRVTETPTAQTIDAFNSAIDHEFQNQLQEKQRYRTYLFIYSGLLLTLLVYAGWRLLRSYRLIAQVNRQLHVANQALEMRVVEHAAELKEQSVRLVELAKIDALTGLINRHRLMEQLQEALQRAERHDRVVAVVFIDLDGFKQVNDRLGHATGDRVLQEVAARIGRHVRKSDKFARFGGDAFVVMLTEAATPDGAVRLSEKILEELRQFTEIDGRPITLSASIGVSSARGGAAEDLLEPAHQAMHQAKWRGRNCYCFATHIAWDMCVVRNVTAHQDYR